MRTVMLTTKDNPFDPYDQFDSWFLFDTRMGYNTCAYMARISHVSEKFPEATNDEEIERVIDQIIEEDPLHIYKKVVYNK